MAKTKTPSYPVMLRIGESEKNAKLVIGSTTGKGGTNRSLFLRVDDLQIQFADRRSSAKFLGAVAAYMAGQ